MLSIRNYTPSDPTLKELIEYYYFLSSEANSVRKEFIHFPHYRTTLNVYFQADIHLNETQRHVTYNPTNDLVTVYTNNKSKFKEAILEGPYNIIGICFNPLGINHFIENDLAKLSSKSCLILNSPWPSFNSDMKQISAQDDESEKVRMLDAFFIEHYRVFQHRTLKQMVNAILESQGQIPVNQLEKDFDLGRRTILRLFKRHLNCSVSEFKRVVKFRSSLSSYQQSSKKPSLTQLSYNHDYYDQSDFIHHFKSLTGGVPGKLLSELIQVDERDIYWQFRK